MTTVILAWLLTLPPEHWFGGREYELRVPMEAERSGAVVVWQLSLGEVPLVSGKTAVPEKSPLVPVRIALPPIRAFVRLNFAWRVGVEGKEAAGSCGVIYAYPPLDWKPAAQLLADRPLGVVGGKKSWGESLARQGLKIKPLSDPNAVDLDDSPLLLVAPDNIAENFQLRPLLDAARAGRHVLVFPQQPKEPLGGLAWEKAPAGGTYRFDMQHALLIRFDKVLLDSWAEVPAETPAIRVTPDLPLTVVAGRADKTDKTTHALLAEQSVGRGTITWLTLPWGAPGEDPRSAMLLNRWIQIHTPSGGTP